MTKKLYVRKYVYTRYTALDEAISKHSSILVKDVYMCY